MPLLFHTACICITALHVILGRKSRALFVLSFASAMQKIKTQKSYAVV